MGVKYFYNFCAAAVDKDDLSGDILSAVRKSYFDDFGKIRDKITLDSDGESVLYEYDIEKDKPMKWVVKDLSGAVLQKAETAENGRYHVDFYRGNDLYKRLLFSKLHTLLKAEYFDDKGAVSCYIEPRKVNSEIRLLYSDASLAQPVILSEAPEASDIRVGHELRERFTDYTVVASTSEGTVLYLTDAQLERYLSLKEELENEFSFEDEESFIGDDAPLYQRINVKDFNVKRNLSSALDISEAKEFDYDISADEPSDEVSAVEAGEAETAEITDTAETVEAAEDAPAQTEEEPEEKESFAVEPDKRIMADGAVYSYFGELDESGNRSGYGRTVTEIGRVAYEGEYANDKRSGKGAYFYRDGSLCYSGEWSENVRHGIGVGVSARDGSMHAGRFVNNKPEGNGVRIGADGVVKFVCKELDDGTTVLMNYQPDDTVIISRYDSSGKKTGEKTISLTDF